MEIFGTESNRLKIGIITQGSLSKGITMRLDASMSVEQLKAGKFVVIEGQKYDFFAMITDVTLEAANKDILLNPPSVEDHFLREVMQGHVTFATVSLKPMIMMNQGLEQEFTEAQRVKTVPTHFSLVADALEEDIARIFGNEANRDDEGNQTHFHIGAPLDMEDIPVCIDMNKFVERSNAVFGKTGTGKTFLTRLLLAGAIKTGKAVNLIFDMHSEYGISARQEGSKVHVKGLKELFPQKVKIFSVDPDSTRHRGQHPDHEVYIYADQIDPEDILPLSDTFNLTQTAAESMFLLYRTYRSKWLMHILNAKTPEDIEAIVQETGTNSSSIDALRRKLASLEGFRFFKNEARKNQKDVVTELLSYIEDGRSIVLEFGKYNNLKAYLLVANIITRRLREIYEEKSNKYLGSNDESDKPQQLLITIEEAHKLLNKEVAHQTPFGKIAREMRKFFVSLLIVDQRPGAIDEEVLSQIGTKIVAQLSDDKDINAVLVGTSDASGLRQVLASLDSKQQALILGHAVPMPIVVKTRSYNDEFYQAMRGKEQDFDALQKEMEDLF
jgi:DNA helicase HerA-like ATPase